ncbi:MAG: hypothetical protein NC398_07075 [Acetatifactor muris]|nr:hypothetical protein [Acetatifactor muris]MCM1525699.1 hypothetical protein [Bacteroides sp.]
MRVADRIQIAFQNIDAGGRAVNRIIFGMTFVIMLIFSCLMIVQSYFAYTKLFNQRNVSDRYYYTEIYDRDVQDITTGALSAYDRDMQERYHAEEMSVLCTLQLRDEDEPLDAGHTGLIVDGTEWQIGSAFQYRNKSYQDIQGSDSPILPALYGRDMDVFAEQITVGYGEKYLWGRYPDNPGEILLDDYILEVYGVLDSKAENSREGLLGKKISIYVADEGQDRIVLNEYLLTGIFRGDLLSARESVTGSDHHLEHIYVNLREDDMDRFVISQGSIRYYFNDYWEYAKHYDQADDILRLNISQADREDGAGVKLTGKGLEYCLLYWLMHHLGLLLMIVTAVIGLVITLSVFYTVRFYRKRNARYLSMLQSIGMERRDRMWISSIEMCYMMFVATLRGVCLSCVFLALFNIITSSALNFRMVLDIRYGAAAIFLSWLYVGICLWFSMGKEYFLKTTDFS